MDFALNKDFVIIGDVENDDLVLLKNVYSNRVFKISPIEYEIIAKFVQTNSVDKTLEYFSQQYSLTQNLVTKIVDIAKENKFIKNTDEKGDEKEFHTYYSDRTYYIFMWLYSTLKLYKLRMKIDWRSNFNLVKIAYWNIQTFSLKFYSYYRKSQYFLVLLALCIIAFIWAQVDLPYILYSIGETRPMLLIIIALPLSLIVSFLHEFSHFAVYRSFGGKQNEIGLALMYRFLPIFYTATEDMILWKSKKRRIYVAIAGIFNDITFFAILVFIQSGLDQGVVNSVISFLIFGLIIKFFYNVNPFAPGSDMYFVSSDLFGMQSPFLKSSEMIEGLFKKRGKGVNFNFGLIFYGFLCYLSIMIYITTFLVLITLPFWINRLV